MVANTGQDDEDVEQRILRNGSSTNQAEEVECEDVVRNGSSTNKFRLHPEKYPRCSQGAGPAQTKKTEKS